MKWNKSAMNRVQPQVRVGHERLWKKDFLQEVLNIQTMKWL